MDALVTLFSVVREEVFGKSTGHARYFPNLTVTVNKALFNFSSFMVSCMSLYYFLIWLREMISQSEDDETSITLLPQNDSISTCLV